MHHSPYLWGLIIGTVSISSLSAAPVLEHTGSIYKNIKENTEMKIESSEMRKFKKSKEVLQSHKKAEKRYFVQKIIVSNNIDLSQKKQDEVLSPYEGRKLTIVEIQEAAKALEQAHLDNGDLTADVAIDMQKISQGIVIFTLSGGVLEEGGLTVENNGKRIKTEIVEKLLNNILQPGLMTRESYERAILLTNDLPGILAKGDLYLGEEALKDDLVVTVSDEALFNGNIDIDNFGSYYTGENEAGATLYWNSPTGNGEEIVARFITTGKYSNYGYLEIEIPVFDYATRIGASVDYLDYELKNQEPGTGGDGTAWNANLFIKYPLIRNEKTTVELEARYDHTNLVDNNLTAQLDDTVIEKGVFTVSGNHSDTFLDNGVTYFELSLTTGNTKLKDEAYKMTDALTTETAGHYTKLNYSMSRLQNIQGDFSSKVSIEGQWASKNLDTSEKYFLGGPYSMAGYPVGQVGGDNAVLLYADLRYDFYTMPWGGDFQLKAFYSYGWVEVMKDPKKYTAYYGVDDKYNEMTLQTVGLGLSQTWSDTIVIRAMVGKQIGENEYREVPGNNNLDYDQSDSDYRAWVEAIYYF
jgi:hemolysin activation/secretion protein